LIAYILSRVLQSFLVMLCVAMISFSLFTYVGDPITNLVGIQSSDEKREQLRESLGLNDPAPVQFGRFVTRAVQLEFGISYQQKRKVSSMIAERLPATLELSILSALIALSIGIPAGIFTALYRDSWFSHLFLSLSLVGVSLPTFLIGILLIFVFSVHLHVLPSFGRGEVVQLGFWSTGLLTASGLKALIMPAITLALFQMTLIMRLVRSEMLEVLRTDFIKFARARGLASRTVHFGYALMNTLVPVITITGLQLGSIIAFAIITETVFQWPGVGLMFIQAINEVDIPVMSTYLMLIASFFVIINLIVDLLYYFVDPRLRVGRGSRL
jgi:peptide/nickel transport system permease protein